MKLNTTDFLRKSQHAILLATGSYPIGVLLAAHTAPELLTRFWPVTVAFVLLSWLCILTPGRRRLLVGCISTAALLALSVPMLSPGQHPVMILLAAMYAFFLLMLLPVGSWPREKELSPVWHMGGFMLHAVMQFLINITHGNDVDLYNAAQTPLLCLFLLFAALSLLSMNRSSMETATQSRRTAPGHMRRLNAFFTIALLVISVLISLIPAIGRTLSMLWDLVMRGIAALVAIIAALMPQQQAQGGGGGPAESMEFGSGPPPEENLLSIILEKIMAVIVLIVLVLLIYFLGRKVLRLLRQALRLLLQKLSSYTAAASEDYVDEITDTREDAEVSRGGLLQRLRMRMPSADEKAMTPAERVRYRYLRLRWRHPEWQRSSTARETLPGEAAQLYEQARYSEQLLSDEDADRFRASTRRLGS